MDAPHYHAAIEAILFAHGEPLSKKRLAQALDISVQALCQQMETLIPLYQQEHRGLMIVTLADCYQLCTKPIYQVQIQQVLQLGRGQALSGASMETLAIIAYNQPVSKSFVEQVRGVDSAGSVNTLLAKGLIEEAGRLKLPGQPITYRTSANFLRCFGLSSLADLPAVSVEQSTVEAH